ncbi:MAG TPA: hypothetical protein VMC61_01165 [Methanocella sp.]|nr:hypothetical protein [Methanocella sp.]
MPIVDGKYEACISTYYATVDQGIADLKKKLQRSRRVRISNIPPKLLEELKPLLAGKDLKIVLPEGMEPDESLRKLGPVATVKARIYANYAGKEASSGSVSFSDRSFGIVWSGDDIHMVSAMDYVKCARCLIDSFEANWRYAQKW